MKKPHRVSLILLCLVAVGCAPVAVREQPAAASIEVADAEIAANIKFAFHERGLEGHERIKVDVTNGEVVLRGRAPAVTAERALAIARNVRGVRSASSEVTPVE